MSNFYTTYLNEVLQKLGPLERGETLQCPPGRGNYTAVALDLDCGASKAIKTAMQNTKREHRGNVGGVFRSYNIKRIERVGNQSLLDKYNSFKTHVRPPHEKMLFHGSNQVGEILSEGFDKQETNPNGMFGAGFYFTDVSSKANQYVFGRNGCPRHGDTSCYRCERQLLLCRVIIGNSLKLTDGRKFDTAPHGYDSVTGVPSQGGLRHKEFVVYKQKQIYPEIVITYKLMP
uniref:Poly [ADP-ribose] polymerase n=1 Tax=Ciona intestinalis TaxID=7719 RepID=A0A1W2WD79_CIOIN|nr:tankyrase-2 [Ciona intestinalis]|eukprot:XP_002127080.1 tankyrase-2 [Ciona intestinalis]